MMLKPRSPPGYARGTRGAQLFLEGKGDHTSISKETYR